MLWTQTYLSFTYIKSKTTHCMHERNLQTRQLHTEPDYNRTSQTANKSPKNAPQGTAAMQLQPCKRTLSIHPVSPYSGPRRLGRRTHRVPEPSLPLTQHSSEGNFLRGVIGANLILYSERT